MAKHANRYLVTNASEKPKLDMLLHATDGWAVIPNWIIYTVTTNIYGLRTDPQTGAPGLGIASSTNICSRKYVMCVRHILRILDKNSLNSDLRFFFFFLLFVQYVCEEIFGAAESVVILGQRFPIQYLGSMPRGPHFGSFAFTNACQNQLLSVSDGLQQRAGFECYYTRHLVPINTQITAMSITVL